MLRPRRACLQLIDAGRSAPPFLQSAPHRMHPHCMHPHRMLTACSPQRTPCIACDRHQHKQWRAREGAGQRRWRVGTWSRGKDAQCGVYLQACMQARTQAGSGDVPGNAPACATTLNAACSCTLPRARCCVAHKAAAHGQQSCVRGGARKAMGMCAHILLRCASMGRVRPVLFWLRC